MSSFDEQRNILVERLVAEGIIKSPDVIRSMKMVRREEFVPDNMRSYAYVDTPLPIGNNQTISAPHMCAIMNEALKLEVGHKVLEVGAGSGYHAALVAEIVAPNNVDRKKWGHIFTVEIIPELSAFAQNNLEREGYVNRVSIICADGSKGYLDEAPYDRIFVTAAAPEVPKPLIGQLKPGGLFVIPIGGLYFFQDLILVEKTLSGKVITKSLGGVAFVPLRGEYGWKT
jgi:protein-L-isoaspartate(D-aspartate) O-methyltransferase